MITCASPKNMSGGSICAARCLSLLLAVMEHSRLHVEHSATSMQPFMVRYRPTSNDSSKKMTTQNAFYNVVNSLQTTKHMDMKKKEKIMSHILLTALVLNTTT